MNKSSTLRIAFIATLCLAGTGCTTLFRPDYCSRSVKTAGFPTWPDFDSVGNDAANLRLRSELISQARPDQFVSVRKPVMSRNARGPRPVAAGEPLLLVSCESRTVIGLWGLDGRYFELPAKTIDGSPKTFVLAPPFLSDDDTWASHAFEASTEEDRAEVPGAEVLYQQMNSQWIGGIAASINAERAVESGPPVADLEAAKQEASIKAIHASDAAIGMDEGAFERVAAQLVEVRRERMQRFNDVILARLPH